MIRATMRRATDADTDISPRFDAIIDRRRHFDADFFSHY